MYVDLTTKVLSLETFVLYGILHVLANLHAYKYTRKIEVRSSKDMYLPP